MSKRDPEINWIEGFNAPFRSINIFAASAPQFTCASYDGIWGAEFVAIRSWTVRMSLNRVLK